ncbi:hypothetical protein [Pseudomonas aeruginosa]|uniref:hypothetical protein n=1 Tax=Pseudomonas aeruginosa TaxID=287 RepID=UPI00287BE88E|nr:hypothetical protein [Pseudomonas aeruginosa]MDS9746601.1 hypothetical protein [Pseudomonas aeruginosa]MDS9771618.1 hypothetical protein [Pseudomonas aeruginosa]
MSKVKRLNFTVDQFESVVPYASEHGQYARYADYAKLEAEAQALMEEVAALRARVAVVPDGYALVPVEPTREMFIAINKEDDKAYAGGCHHGAQFEWLWAAAIEAAPRPNGLTVSEGLLRKWLELMEHGDYREGHCMCGSPVDSHGIGDGHAPIDAGEYYAGQVMEELRALLNQDKENGNG